MKKKIHGVNELRCSENRMALFPHYYRFDRIEEVTQMNNSTL